MEKNLDYKKHTELTQIIIGVFYDVYNELGFGLLESVYRKSFALALKAKGLTVKEEAPITVYFRSQNVGDFKADLVANELILIELKTADTLVTAHEAQVLNYLRATSLEVGLLLTLDQNPNSAACSSTMTARRQNVIALEGHSELS